MTFDEWLDEIEVYSARRDRLNEDVNFEAVMTGNMSHNLARNRMYVWLEAAYNVGYKTGIEALGFPNYPHPISPTFPMPLVEAGRNCSRCGISLTGAMGYVCSDAQCPTFPRVTCVTTGQHTTSAVNLGTKSTEGYNG